VAPGGGAVILGQPSQLGLMGKPYVLRAAG
jgi:hypothetical protein